MTPRRLVFLCIAAALTGCGDFPELDAATSEAALNASYLDLRPVEALRATVPDKKIDDDTDDRLQSRADNLRARAARLRGGVLDSQARARLAQDISVDEAEG